MKILLSLIVDWGIHMQVNSFGILNACSGGDMQDKWWKGVGPSGRASDIPCYLRWE
jgi:hypothetical protein